MPNQKILKVGATDALFIIDMLNAFNKGGSLPVSGIVGEIDPDLQIEQIVSLTKYPFGLFVFTGDEHPGDHIEFSIYGKHALAGSFDAEMIDLIKWAYEELPEDRRLWYPKGQDRRLIGYSIAFSLYYGELIHHLRSKGFKRLFFCGRAYTHCVGESAVDAKGQMFEAFVIRNLSLSLPPPIGDVARMEGLLKIMSIKEVSSQFLF